jgi:hypothetical protein
LTWDTPSFDIGHEPICLQPDEEIPERERQTMQSEKVMITIVWNPSGFHLIKLPSKGFKFTRITASLKFLIHSQFGAELTSEGRIETHPARR